MPNFERDRERAIVAMWRGGEPLEFITEYVGMAESDVAQIIIRQLNYFPSLGMRSKRDMDLLDRKIARLADERRAIRLKELRPCITTPALRRRIDNEIETSLAASVAAPSGA